jgi:hypothetical protein
MRTIPTNSYDIIDSRDVIARIEELEGEREGLADEVSEAEECVKFHHNGTLDPDGTFPEHAEYRRCRNELADWIIENEEELTALKKFADQAEGYASDWHHGAQLISDDYFETYARQLADDLGAVNSDARWPNNCIDWEQAASELQQDYSAVDFDGTTYWVR